MFNTIFESYDIKFLRENKYKNASCEKAHEITVFHSFSKSQTCNMAFKDFTVEDQRKAICFWYETNAKHKKYSKSLTWQEFKGKC